MIEINIPEQAAINLLRDQVNLEFKRQKKMGLLDIKASIETLEENKLREIVEISLFDILVLLPVTLITEESNLPQIIVKAVRALSTEYDDTFLAEYGENEAKSILLLIRKSFGDFSNTTTYQNN